MVTAAYVYEMGRMTSKMGNVSIEMRSVFPEIGRFLAAKLRMEKVEVVLAGLAY